MYFEHSSTWDGQADGFKDRQTERNSVSTGKWNIFFLELKGVGSQHVNKKLCDI
jgi:hypothetical protein